MVELARTYPDNIVTVKEMARNQLLSVKYLESIIAPLKAAGLVKAVRGFHGGYTLARPPSAIRLSEIYQILEGSLAPVKCVDTPEICPMHDRCPTRSTWGRLKDALAGVLDNTTIQDLLDGWNQPVDSSPPMFQI